MNKNIITASEITRLTKALEIMMANKAGIGPGSICTTRVIVGVGIPQISNLHGSKNS